MIALAEDQRARIHEFCRRHHLRRLWLIGSAVRGDFAPARSDLDFLVEFDPATGQRGFGGDYFGLRTGFEDIMQRHVDLVELGAIRKARFLQTVERHRVSLYAA